MNNEWLYQVRIKLPQDLADDFFANGTPHPLELRTEIKEN